MFRLTEERCISEDTAQSRRQGAEPLKKTLTLVLWFLFYSPLRWSQEGGPVFGNTLYSGLLSEAKARLPVSFPSRAEPFGSRFSASPSKRSLYNGGVESPPS